jgi:hydroxyacylglutathione hydrolase
MISSNDYVMQRTVTHANPIDIFTMMDDGEEMLLVDVRENSEFIGDLGHIPSSINVPLSGLETFLKEHSAERGKKLVFVCATGDRSLYACNLALQSGFTNPVNMRGGMVQWHLSGLEVVNDE